MTGSPFHNAERRNGLFKVEITETWTEDEFRKEWRQVRDVGLATSIGTDKQYEYVEAVLPTAQRRTILEAELAELDVARVVLAVFGLADLPQATGLRVR